MAKAASRYAPFSGDALLLDRRYRLWTRYTHKPSEFYTDIIQPYIYDNALFDCSFTTPCFYYYSAWSIKPCSVCAGSVSRSKSSAKEIPWIRWSTIKILGTIARRRKHSETSRGYTMLCLNNIDSLTIIYCVLFSECILQEPSAI